MTDILIYFRNYISRSVQRSFSKAVRQRQRSDNEVVVQRCAHNSSPYAYSFFRYNALALRPMRVQQPEKHRPNTPEQKANRLILRNAMLRHGFLPLDTEWWHFTLDHEPYPDTYFDFPVTWH